MIHVEHWGLIPYQESMDKQLKRVDMVAQGLSPETIISCSHPPVVTIGRKTQDSDLYAWSGEIVEVSRGGRATYHGPSQIVIYPILNLNLEKPHRPPRDVVWLLRVLENSLIECLSQFNLQAHGKQGIDDTGVWVEHKKVASVGIAVKNWVSYHGMAINIENDPAAFLGVNPCGYHPSVMTNLESLLGHTVDRNIFDKNLIQILMTKL